MASPDQGFVPAVLFVNAALHSFFSSKSLFDAFRLFSQHIVDLVLAIVITLFFITMNFAIQVVASEFSFPRASLQHTNYDKFNKQDRISKEYHFVCIFISTLLLYASLNLKYEQVALALATLTGIALDSIIVLAYPVPNLVPPRRVYWMRSYFQLNVLASIVATLRLVKPPGVFDFLSGFLCWWVSVDSLAFYIHGIVRERLLDAKYESNLTERTLKEQVKETFIIMCGILLVLSVLPISTFTVSATYLCCLGFCTLSLLLKYNAHTGLDPLPPLPYSNVLREIVVLRVFSEYGYYFCLLSTFVQRYYIFVRRDYFLLLYIAKYLNFCIGMGVLYQLRLKVLSRRLPMNQTQDLLKSIVVIYGLNSSLWLTSLYKVQLLLSIMSAFLSTVCYLSGERVISRSTHQKQQGHVLVTYLSCVPIFIALALLKERNTLEGLRIGGVLKGLLVVMDEIIAGVCFSILSSGG